MQEAVNRLLQASDRPWCTFGTCRHPGHDHSTTQAGDGADLDIAIPMRCADCGQPAHCDTTFGGYRHDNPHMPDCFLIRTPSR